MSTTNAAATNDDRSQEGEAALGARIAFGEPLYNQAMDFLILEARLLDDNKLLEWFDLLAEDIQYRMPVRSTVFRREGEGFDPGMNFIYDNKNAIRFKVRRYTETDTAWAEDPPSRVRRLVTNLMLFETPNPEELMAQSYLLLQRSRGDSPTLESLTARRDDVVRRTAAGWRLAQRTIWIDQATLGMANLAVFL